MQLRIKFISSTAHCLPYSTADIVYGVENSQSDVVEGKQNNLVDITGKESRISSCEITESNNRHLNEKEGIKKPVSAEKVNSFKESDDNLRSQQNFPFTKYIQYRPNGIRSNSFRGEPVHNMRTNSLTSGKDTEDLIAMGTIWSPNTQTPVKQMYSSTSGASSTTNSVTIRNVLTTSTQSSSSSTGIPQGSRGRYNIAGIKPIMVQTPKNINIKEVDPRYTDPILGAPASFQQRLMELSALEAETIRYERNKKVKKKVKQDRDS